MPQAEIKREDFPISYAIGVVLLISGLLGCIIAEGVDHSDVGAIITLSIACVGGVIMVVNLFYRIGHKRP